MHENFTREVFWAKESKNEVKNGIQEEQVALKFICWGIFLIFLKIKVNFITTFYYMLESSQSVLNVIFSWPK